jgi:Ca2+-binding RTX toxin-like protein
VANINGTGNALNNVITGNSGVNILNGGAGADTMAGGTGNDEYVVDNALDVVTELAGEGTDRVWSTVNYTLGATLENLTLIGTSNINGTGNALNNVIVGNGVANTLTGGTGNDLFIFNTALGASNVDTVTDFVSGQDRVALSASIFTAFAGQVGATVGLSANLTYNAGTGALAYDADGAGAGAAVDVAVIGSPTHPATLGNDFLIIA